MNRFNTLEGTTMRLFTVGPVQMREDIKRSGIDIPYFRTQEFSELMLDSDRILKKLAGTYLKNNLSHCLRHRCHGSNHNELLHSV